jgi:CLIP-associating protein 1/2
VSLIVPIQTLIDSLRKNEELLQYGLIVLWEMLEHLTLPMEGHEAEVFTILLTARYSNKQQVSQYANNS